MGTCHCRRSLAQILPGEMPGGCSSEKKKKKKKEGYFLGSNTQPERVLLRSRSRDLGSALPIQEERER